MAEMPRGRPFPHIRIAVQGLGCMHLAAERNWIKKDGQMQRGRHGLHRSASLQVALHERETD